MEIVLYVEALAHAFGEIDTLLVLQGGDGFVHLLLTDEPCGELEQPPRNLGILLGGLLLDSLLDID